MSEDRPQTTMTTNWISPDRLRTIISTYGAAAERWPIAERDAALALVARSDAARAMRDTAADLDSALESLQPPPPSDTLEARLRRLSPPRDPGVSAPRWHRSLGGLFSGWRWPPVAAGALGVLLVGAALNLTVPTPEAPTLLPMASTAVPSEQEEDAPGLLAGVALVDPLPPEPLDGSGGFSDSDLGIDSSMGFREDGGTTLEMGGLALE